MLLNERIDKKRTADQYLKSLTNSKRQQVKVENMGSFTQGYSQQTPEEEAEMSVFNVTNFMRRFTNSRAGPHKDSVKNWSSMAKLTTMTQTDIFQTEGTRIEEEQDTTKMSNRQLLKLNNLVLAKNKEAVQQTVSPVNVIEQAVARRPAKSAIKIDYSGRYWRETNLKYKERHCPQFRPRGLDGNFSENDDEEIDFRTTILQSIQVGPAEEVKKKDKRDEIMNSRPAKHIKSVRIQNYDSQFHKNEPNPYLKASQFQPRFVSSIIMPSLEKTDQVEGEKGAQQQTENTAGNKEEIKILEGDPMQSFLGDMTLIEPRRPKDTPNSANTNIKNYLEEQSRRAKSAQEEFYKTHLRPLNDADCWTVYKYLVNKSIDNEDYSVLDNEWSANLPNPILFAKEFKFFVVNFDQELFLSGKARLLKTKWIQLATDFVVPSIRDLVYHCCGQESEIALVILVVEDAGSNKSRHIAKFVNTKNPFIYEKMSVLMKTFEKIVKLCLRLKIGTSGPKGKPGKAVQSFPERFQKLIKLAPMLADLYRLYDCRFSKCISVEFSKGETSVFRVSDLAQRALVKLENYLLDLEETSHATDGTSVRNKPAASPLKEGYRQPNDNMSYSEQNWMKAGCKTRPKNSVHWMKESSPFISNYVFARPQSKRVKDRVLSKDKRRAIVLGSEWKTKQMSAGVLVESMVKEINKEQNTRNWRFNKRRHKARMEEIKEAMEVQRARHQEGESESSQPPLIYFPRTNSVTDLGTAKAANKSTEGIPKPIEEVVREHKKVLSRMATTQLLASDSRSNRQIPFG